MRRIGIIINIFLLLNNLNGQQLQMLNPNPEELHMYDESVKLIKNAKYSEADSILSVALCTYRNENVYYNRAVSRLFLNDTLGSCQDLDIAANSYFDVQSQLPYKLLCCSKVDTFFYDKKRMKSDKTDYRYYEIVKYSKYDSIIRGSFHDIKTTTSQVNFYYGRYNNFGFEPSHVMDIIAGYVIENDKKYYYKASQPISFYTTQEYINLKNKAKNLFSSKYSHLKYEFKKEELSLFYKVYFNESGNLVKIEYIGFFPTLAINDIDISKIKKDLQEIANSFPKVKPARFFKEKVCFVTYDSIVF